MLPQQGRLTHLKCFLQVGGAAEHSLEKADKSVQTQKGRPQQGFRHLLYGICLAESIFSRFYCFLLMSVPQEEASSRREQLSHPISSLVWLPYILNCCTSSTSKTSTTHLSLTGFTVVSRRQLPDKLCQVECLGAQNSKLVPGDKVSLRDEI